MILAKNYETLSKFVKVMPRILWPLFSGHGVDRSEQKPIKNFGKNHLDRPNSLPENIINIIQPNNCNIVMWR